MKVKININLEYIMEVKNLQLIKVLKKDIVRHVSKTSGARLYNLYLLFVTAN